MILVVGGTGMLGARVVQMLVEAGQPIRCLVRTGTADGELRGSGVEVVRGDLTDPGSLPAALLAAALQRADGDDPRSVLDYAREKLFDPLGITTRPAFTEPILDDTTEFDWARFAWTTDPRGISMGAFGIRLTAPDLVKLGELHLNDGVWHGRQILPAGWVREATTASEAEPQYGLMWSPFTWNAHQVYAARGTEGHLIVVVPDQRSVTAISSANNPEYALDEEALFPLVNELVIPTIDRS